MLEVAVVAARLAGQRAMEEKKYVKYSIKNDDEIVTPTDSICQKIIIERIKEIYPDHGFIAAVGFTYGVNNQVITGKSNLLAFTGDMRFSFRAKPFRTGNAYQGDQGEY